MAMLISLLSIGAAIGSLICWILVLIKLFQNEGPLWGILGIICGLYALIWGWMNADKHNIRQVVMIWTILIIANVALSFLGGGFSRSIPGLATP